LLGDGFLPYMVTPGGCRRMFGSVEAHAEVAGRRLASDYAWCAYVYLSLGDDPAEARRRGDHHLAWRYDEPRFAGDLAGKYVVAGEAEACAEGLLRFREAGCTHLVLSLVRRDGESPAEAVRAVAEGVLPLVRS
jgi:alkanesulfonate monooxygenase SsuD/methylene tetrahydromethanopterin reductase-like flavin-dependent oxidoreductase (luciferase family)